MKLKKSISLPKLWLIAGTRGALGFGMGLLASDKLNRRQRRSLGKTLLLGGIATTIPLVLSLFERE